MSLKLDSATTALVLIDLQKGILGRTLSPHASAQVVEKSVALSRKLKETGGTIVLVHVAFSLDGADRLKQPVDETMVLPSGGFPPDFSQFVDPIAALPADVIILKRQWGAFHGTELDLQLRRRGITTIILGGVSTNMGVESTAREAWQHGYAVVIAEDACSSMAADMHEFAMKKILPRIARIRSTQEILDGLTQRT